MVTRSFRRSNGQSVLEGRLSESRRKVVSTVRWARTAAMRRPVLTM
jgi:hypothetical protein